MNSFLNKKIVVNQVRSGSKLTPRQKATLVGLGLKGIGSSSELSCSPSVLGMIKSVSHVVKASIA